VFSLCHLAFFKSCHAFRQQFSLYLHLWFAIALEEFQDGPHSTRRDPLLWCFFAQRHRSRKKYDSCKDLTLGESMANFTDYLAEAHQVLMTLVWSVTGRAWSSSPPSYP
jgi:hypothetical protein